MRDPRIWTPDETCEPFQLATCGNVGTGSVIFEFRVPSGYQAVVKKISSFASGGASAKDLTNVRFRKAAPSRGLQVLADLSGVPMSGNLQGVYERGTVAGDNIPGWILSNADQAFEICLVLDEGEWQCFNGGTGSGGAATVVRLSGYCFPLRQRDRG